MSGRRCACGIPPHWGMPWATWHRIHEQHHLATFPHVDDRTRNNLKQIGQLPNDNPNA